ncbi:MAG: tRNA pseudouridine(55) synthase TruB [Acidobacteria bacterium]|nr:tRNA pseudouridine(55) synthase TruB [Acidobacteriota bacterium]
MNGILIIDKPEGFTSHDVVARLRRILKTKKIGHTGTLDPFATGVLVMLVGKATRLAQFLDRDVKSYEADVRFGFETDTGDRTGARRDTPDAIRGPQSELRITYNELQGVLPEFTGEIEQIPPMYSAKKVDGKKLYELARKGVEIKREAVKVTISELELLPEISPKEDEELKTQDFRIKVTCTAGTYIRTLAEDIGRKLGTGCHLAELRRIKAGRFEISQAVSIEELEDIVSEDRLSEILVSMNDAISHLPGKNLDEDELKKIQNGIRVAGTFEDDTASIVRLTNSGDELVAIGEYDHSVKMIHPKIVFNN